MDNILEEDFGTFGTMGEDSAKKDPVEAMFKSKLPSTMLLRIKVGTYKRKNFFSFI